MGCGDGSPPAHRKGLSPPQKHFEFFIWKLCILVDAGVLNGNWTGEILEGVLFSVIDLSVVVLVVEFAIFPSKCILNNKTLSTSCD